MASDVSLTAFSQFGLGLLDAGVLRGERPVEGEQLVKLPADDDPVLGLDLAAMSCVALGDPQQLHQVGDELVQAVQTHELLKLTN